VTTQPPELDAPELDGAVEAPRTPFTGIRRIQRTQEVRHQLESAIARGDYRPGDKLPSERELVATFGVSRITVREAIRSLEALGLVYVQQGRGCFVSELVDPAPFDHWLSVHHRALLDLLRIRGALDALAAEYASHRREPQELAAIQAAQTAFEAAVADPETPVQQLVQLDIAFHRTIADASSSILLVHLLEQLSTYLGESRRFVLSPPHRPRESAVEHAAIVAEIVDGNPAGARDAVHRHIEGVINTLRQLEAAAAD
jgi:GntR family transcriptional regulator, transcriptional repressor for pyruvate dehydrogenase complex